MSGISAWSWLVGGAVTGLLGYANLPMSWLASTQTTTATYRYSSLMSPITTYFIPDQITFLGILRIGWFKYRERKKKWKLKEKKIS